MITAVILYKRNGHYLRVTGVTYGADKAPLNRATVTATLHYGATCNSEVDGLVLPYVEGSDGDYEGVIPASFDGKVGLYYTLDIDISSPGLEPAHREMPCIVQIPSIP